MALENMAAQFKGLPMGDLIGGPLDAACDAQVRLARATVDFIREVGFEDASNGTWGRTRTARFDFNRPVMIAPGTPPRIEKGVTVPGKAPMIGSERVSLEVPVLAIVNIPSLSVKTVDITFDMEVKSAETSKDSKDSEASADFSAGVKIGPFHADVKIHGSVSTHQENTRSSDNSAKYHVQVHAQDAGMPEGLSRVLDILAQSVAPAHVDEVKEVKLDDKRALLHGDEPADAASKSKAASKA